MGLERWRIEDPTIDRLTCGCEIIWYPGSHISPGLLRCALHRSVSDLLTACKATIDAMIRYRDGGEDGDFWNEATVMGRAAIAKAEPKQAPDV